MNYLLTIVSPVQTYRKLSICTDYENGMQQEIGHYLGAMSLSHNWSNNYHDCYSGIVLFKVYNAKDESWKVPE